MYLKTTRLHAMLTRIPIRWDVQNVSMENVYLPELTIVIVMLTNVIPDLNVVPKDTVVKNHSVVVMVMCVMSVMTMGTVRPSTERVQLVLTGDVK